MWSSKSSVMWSSVSSMMWSPELSMIWFSVLSILWLSKSSVVWSSELSIMRSPSSFQVLEFLQPAEMKEVLDLDLPLHPHSLESLLQSCQQTLHYQVKSGRLTYPIYPQKEYVKEIIEYLMINYQIVLFRASEIFQPIVDGIRSCFDLRRLAGQSC